MTRLWSRTRWRSCAGAMQAARSMAQLSSRCANDWNVLDDPAISLGACSFPFRKERDCMRSLVEPLVSNGYTLEMTPERLGWLEPTDAGLPLEQLREKFRQNGYLWLKRKPQRYSNKRSPGSGCNPRYLQAHPGRLW